MGFGSERGGEFTVSKVAVFGDAMLDVYYTGTADRLSAEAPIPVVKIDKPITAPGGAGNVIANLKALGVEVVDCTSYGPVKNRLMVGDHQIARWDQHDYCESWEGAMPQDVDAIVIADYNKGGVPRNVQWPRDIPLFVDTKISPRLYPGWAIMFPNQVEYSQYEEEYNTNEWTVLKQGERGLVLLHQGGTIYTQSTLAKFVRSVNGAGDSILAAFVFNYLSYLGGPEAPENDKMKWACQFANAAAACVVEKLYTSTITLEEIQCRLR